MPAILVLITLFAFAGPIEAQTATPHQRKTVALFTELLDLINAGVFDPDPQYGVMGFGGGNPPANAWLKRVDEHTASSPGARKSCFDISPFDRRARYLDMSVCAGDLYAFIPPINRMDVDRINYLVDIFTLIQVCGTMSSRDCVEYQRRKGL